MRTGSFWNSTRTRIQIRSGRRLSASMYSKRWLKKNDERSHPHLWSTLVISVLFVGLCCQAADKVKELQDHFDHDPHAGGKVKTLSKLADAQFEAAGKAGTDGDYVSVGLILKNTGTTFVPPSSFSKSRSPMPTVIRIIAVNWSLRSVRAFEKWKKPLSSCLRRFALPCRSFGRI